MNDFIHKIFNVIDHNRYLAGGLLILALTLAYVIGCKPMTSSMLDPNKQVTAAQLETELDAIQANLDQEYADIQAALVKYENRVKATNAGVDTRVKDLTAQAERNKAIFDFVGQAITALAAGNFNPATAIPSALGLAGMILTPAVMLDNRRKDRVIASRSAPVATAA